MPFRHAPIMTGSPGRVAHGRPSVHSHVRAVLNFHRNPRESGDCSADPSYSTTPQTPHGAPFGFDCHGGHTNWARPQSIWGEASPNRRIAAVWQSLDDRTKLEDGQVQRDDQSANQDAENGDDHWFHQGR